MEIAIGVTTVTTILLALLALVLVFKGIKVVPQSDVFVIERFGKFTKTLQAGLNFIVPFLDRVAHKISILERQLPEFTISVITKDNVEVKLDATVFYRITDAASSVYRILDIDHAIHTASTSIVRSAAGKLELDELQSSRESMNVEIAENLQNAATVWGIEITRTEITDIIVDEETKSVLIIGHNPTLHFLIETLTKEHIHKFATCNMAIINFNNNWKNLSEGECKLELIIKPKEIKL